MGGKMNEEHASRRQGMRYRRFAVYVIAVLAVFVSGNYLIWKCATEDLLTKKYDGGDLARIGYLHGSKQYRKISNDLPVRHFGMKEYKGQPIDVMTIGDSFSLGGGEGKNCYYQDYLASLNNFTVLNVYPYPSDDHVMGFAPITTLSILYNSGYLDRIKPRYILIETVVRYSMRRFVTPFTFTRTDTRENIDKYYAKTTYSLDYLPKVTFVNQGNFKYLYYNLMYKFSDNAFRRLVYRRTLDRSFFSVKNDRDLVFWGEDLQVVEKVNKESVKALNDNFNRLSDILAEKGIKLYFMPIVDKYDLYSDYIVGNPYPRNRFFEELRALPRRYTLIDTKAILAEELRKGEKDIFHADDSHWTWKASKAVFEKVTFPGGHPAPAR